MMDSQDQVCREYVQSTQAVRKPFKMTLQPCLLQISKKRKFALKEEKRRDCCYHLQFRMNPGHREYLLKDH